MVWHQLIDSMVQQNARGNPTKVYQHKNDLLQPALPSLSSLLLHIFELFLAAGQENSQRNKLLVFRLLSEKRIHLCIWLTYLLCLVVVQIQVCSETSYLVVYCLNGFFSTYCNS